MGSRIERLGLPMSRRDFLVRGTGGALTLAGLSMANTVFATPAPIDPTPSVTVGPYWVEELLFRSDIRSDPATGIIQPGYPMSLQINLYQIVGTALYALPNAVVDVWHANAFGFYSDEAVQGTRGQKFLRGLQNADQTGKVTFLTVYPGWYSGRTTHIHARIRVFNPVTYAITYNFVTQFFFNDTVTSQVYSSIYPYNTRGTRDTLNARDSVYTGASGDGEVKSNAGSKLLLNLNAYQYYATSQFNVLINLSDAGYNNPNG